MPTLRPHQAPVKDYIVQHPKCGIYLQMGGGKSLCTLTALAEVRPAGHILVIAPINIARSTWIQEIEKWGFPLRMRSFIVNDNDKKISKAKRLELYRQVWTDAPTMYFINVELVDDLVKNMPVQKIDGKKTIMWPFTTVIIDESQTMKSASSARFKAMDKVAESTIRLIELTGTPTPDGLMDLWSQMKLLDGGLALGSTISEYREKYFKVAMTVNNRPVKWEPLPGAEEAIYARVGHMVMSTDNSGIPMPDFSIDQVPIVLPKDVMKTYREFAKTLVLELADPTALRQGKIVITADNQGILHGKLVQFASGTIYTDEQKNYAVIHEEKLAMTDYLLRNNGGSPTIVAYRFRSDKAQLLNYLTAAGHHVEVFDGSRSMIDRWNAGVIPVMLLQPASASHGLNLQDGGHTFIWYTLPGSLEHYLQANARLVRMGQENRVQIWTLVTKGTRDEKLPVNLARKDAVQKGLLNAVRIVIDSAFTDEELYDILGDLDLSPV